MATEPIKPHNSGKIVKPTGPKQVAKPTGPKHDLPDGTTFNDNPSEQPTVILHAEDNSGKNELVQKMLREQQAKQPKAPEKQHEAKHALPTELYQPPHTPASQPRPSTPASNSKRIPMVNPHIAKLEEIFKLYGTVAHQIAVIEMKKKPEWEHIVPEEIRKSDEFQAELRRQVDSIEAFYTHVKKLLTDTSYYTSMQANAEQMHQKTAAALEQLAAKEAAIKAREAQAAGAAGLTKSGYQQKVAEIEEERIALAQERADIASKFAEQKRLSEKLEAEQHEFEREKKKFCAERDADRETLAQLQKSTEMLGQREKAVQVLEEQVNKQMAALQADRKALDDMIAAYQTDEESLRRREEELKEYNRQNDAVRASNDSVAASLQSASKAYDAKAKELEQRESDLSAAAKKVLDDNEKLQKDRALYEQQKAEFDAAKAAYEADKADLDSQRATLQKGFAQVEQQERTIIEREKHIGADIEKVVAQRVAEVHRLVHEVLGANQNYVTTMRTGSDELLRKIADLTGSVASTRACYASEDEKRKKIYEAAVKKLNELMGGNKPGEKK
jgi:chromosome segregation ATPase